MVVIIGGGKRIGKGLVKAYSKKHQVLFTYHSSEGFKGKNIRAARLDVRNILEIKAFAKSFKPKSVKALIYVASSFKRVNFGATLESEFDEIFETNVKGAYFLCEAMQSKMKKGSNVQFFSDVLIDKMPTARLPYSIAKAGLTPLVKILARNWAPDIRVNEIRFGYELLPDKVSEKLKKKWLKEIPMKRYGGIEGAVAASEFLTKESYITGTQLDVDGGLSL